MRSVRCQQAGLTYETIVEARYCLCTALDEAAALTPWGSSGVWSSNGLLVTFHNETWGGEKFFRLLARLSQKPHEPASRAAFLGAKRYGLYGNTVL